MGAQVKVAEAGLGLTEPKLLRLYEYWVGKLAEREMPARKDIDPSEIPDLLPNIFLIDVSYDPNSYCFRLAGTEIVRLFQEEVSGKTIDQLETVALRALLRSHCETAVTGRAPASNNDAFVHRRKSFSYGWVLLPLSADGRVIDMLLGCCVMLRRRRRLR